MKPQIVGWMGKRDASRGADTNYRRLEQDYEFSGGYGLKEPAGWEPLYALDAKDLLILELALKQQTERAEKAEAELAKLRKQEPVAIYDGVEMSRYTLRWTNGPIPVDTNLYTNPIPAPAVPEEWREVMAELAADLQACIEAEHAYRDQYSSVMRKYQNDMRIVERACALLQSAPTGEPK